MESKHVGKRKRPKHHHHHYQPSILDFAPIINIPTSSSSMDIDDENKISEDFKKIKLQISTTIKIVSCMEDDNSDLPGTILMDVLSRLPLRILFEFRAVCKAWRCLLSESYFCRLYSIYAPTTLFLKLKFTNSVESFKEIMIIDRQSGSLATMTMSGGSNPNKVTVEGFGRNTRFQVGNGCNGLICLREVQTREPSLVWNPVLRQIVVVPKPATTSDSKVVAGFGFCAPTNRYKVLRIFHVKGDPLWRQRAEVYELGVGDKWRGIGDVLLPIPSRIPGFFTNNSLHWILDCNKDDGSGEGDNESNVLVSKFELIVGFDFVEEKFKAISSPPIFSMEHQQKYHWSNLGIIGSHLSICAIHAKVFRPDVQVWVMEEYGVQESWVLRLSIRDLAVEWWDPYRWMQLTNSVNNGEICMLCAHSYVFAYNLENRQFRKIEVLDFPVIAHVPSFISLEDVMNEHNGSGALKGSYRVKLLRIGISTRMNKRNLSRGKPETWDE